VKIFYAARGKIKGAEECPLREGAVYEPHHAQMIEWIKQIRAMDRRDVSITSFDGLTLRGKYYEYAPDAPMEILFHGYRGSAKRDLCGGVARCFALGRSALIVDHRAAGESEGHVITFGINERHDCLSWINFVVSHFGSDVKIIITGVSMGAATVMLAAAEDLPSNVVCALADCGYTSAEEIIKKIVAEMKLPPKLIYPFITLAARIFGRFNLNETSPIEAMKNAKIPVIFIHGDTDDFVPCDMSSRLYEACVTQKKFVVIHGAGHGLAFPIDQEGYVEALRQFEQECNF
jgi:fermentation-respiration switch protein FrsA (DUF1100 family)